MEGVLRRKGRINMNVRIVAKRTGHFTVCYYVNIRVGPKMFGDVCRGIHRLYLKWHQIACTVMHRHIVTLLGS
jgi:hypothetical protein